MAGQPVSVTVPPVETVESLRQKLDGINISQIVSTQQALTAAQAQITALSSQNKALDDANLEIQGLLTAANAEIVDLNKKMVTLSNLSDRQGLHSSEFWLVLLGAIVVFVNKHFGLNLDDTSVVGLFSAIVTYSAGRSWIKTKAVVK